MSRINPRTVILDALKSAPLTRGGLAHVFLNEFWRASPMRHTRAALLDRHLCHLERSGRIRRHTIIGPGYRQTSYTRIDSAVRRAVRELARLTADAVITISEGRAEYLELAPRPCRVVASHAGKVDVQPDGRTIPPLANVPVKGDASTCQPGTRGTLGWEDGDPARPYFTGDEAPR